MWRFKKIKRDRISLKKKKKKIKLGEDGIHD